MKIIILNEGTENEVWINAENISWIHHQDQKFVTVDGAEFKFDVTGWSKFVDSFKEIWCK
jgi:hypothetical protein